MQAAKAGPAVGLSSCLGCCRSNWHTSGVTIMMRVASTLGPSLFVGGTVQSAWCPVCVHKQAGQCWLLSFSSSSGRVVF
jgi:hypothetical protein